MIARDEQNAALLGRRGRPAAVHPLAGYAGLLRFPNHVTFLSVVGGALVAADRIDAELLASLAMLYVCFNVLLYGGIYAANALTDVESDAAHPRKRDRPIPSGAVSRRGAVVFSAAAIGAGLLGGLVLFEPRIFLVFLAALAVNAGYSLAARNVPYLELVGNAAPHPLRLLMGIYLAGGDAPHLFLAGFLLFGIGASAARRIVEKSVLGWEARRTLASYSERGLLAVRLACLVGIAALAAADTAERWPLHLALAAAYVAGILCFERFRLLAGYYVWAWTR